MPFNNPRMYRCSIINTICLSFMKKYMDKIWIGPHKLLCGIHKANACSYI